MKNNRNGWLKIHYSLLDWEWYDDLPTRVLFQHLLLRANYADAVWHGIEIKRGQILTSRATLVKESGLTEQQVRTALKHLVSTNEITTEVTNKYTIVTICNYVVYQGEENETNQQNNQQSNKQVTNNQPATNQQLTTRKEEYNNIRKEEKEDNKENTPTSRSKKETKPKFNFKKRLLELGVDEAVADEWIAIRKLKKKTNSEYALSREIAQVEKAGITMDEALTICCDNGWGQFKAEWLGNLIRSQVNRQTQGGGRGRGHTLEEMARIVDAGIALNDILGTRNERERNGETWSTTGR